MNEDIHKHNVNRIFVVDFRVLMLIDNRERNDRM